MKGRVLQIDYFYGSKRMKGVVAVKKRCLAINRGGSDTKNKNQKILLWGLTNPQKHVTNPKGKDLMEKRRGSNYDVGEFVRQTSVVCAFERPIIYLFFIAFLSIFLYNLISVLAEVEKEAPSSNKKGGKSNEKDISDIFIFIFLIQLFVSKPE
jgi:hypothetical protein